jgi:2-polyprenyl-3-methyl-5-hydroxy-6-metoxy-1,4-benzoquinol methylase
MLIDSLFAQTRKPIDPRRYEILSGLRTSRDDRSSLERKPINSDFQFGKVPAKFLSRNYHYIPEGSLVLDVGMGGGRNAVFLARKGYNVTGLEANKKLSVRATELAEEFGVRINIVNGKVKDHNPNQVLYDAIICFYYVDRTLHEKLMSWLRPGGILIYESYTERQLKTSYSEKLGKSFLLKEGELLELFPKMRILKYEEPIHQNDFIASIILQKPRN